MTPELIKSVVNRTDSKPIEKKHLFYYFARWYTGLSYAKLGKLLNQSRSNVFYSILDIRNRILTDKDYKNKVNSIEVNLSFYSDILIDVEDQIEGLMELVRASIEMEMTMMDCRIELNQIKKRMKICR